MSETYEKYKALMGQVRALGAEKTELEHKMREANAATNLKINTLTKRQDELNREGMELLNRWRHEQ